MTCWDPAWAASRAVTTNGPDAASVRTVTSRRSSSKSSMARVSKRSTRLGLASFLTGEPTAVLHGGSHRTAQSRESAESAYADSLDRSNIFAQALSSFWDSDSRIYGVRVQLALDAVDILTVDSIRTLVRKALCDSRVCRGWHLALHFYYSRSLTSVPCLNSRLDLLTHLFSLRVAISTR